MMRLRLTAILAAAVTLAGCAAFPTTDDLCRRSSRCTPACDADFGCGPGQGEGRTRG